MINDQPESNEDTQQQHSQANHNLIRYFTYLMIASIVIMMIAIVIPQTYSYISSKETQCTVLEEPQIMEQVCKEHKCSGGRKNKKCRWVNYKCFNWTIHVQYKEVNLNHDDFALLKTIESQVRPLATVRYLREAQEAVQPFIVGYFFCF